MISRDVNLLEINGWFVDYYSYLEWAQEWIIGNTNQMKRTA